MNGTFKKINGAGPELYHFPALESLGFKTFVSGRGGGVSPEPFHSLNTNYSGGDSEENVRENMSRIKSALKIERLWAPSQVHGDDVAIIEQDAPAGITEADAVIISSPSLAVGVRTADCLPLIIADPVKRAAAAIHAGRRSTELHITAKTIKIMAEKFGSDPADMSVALGPCIRNCCYHVDKETAARFHACCGGGGGQYLDIVEANIRQLLESGVRQTAIVDSGICSSCDNLRFYSYRKDGNVTGRFISGVALA